MPAQVQQELLPLPQWNSLHTQPEQQHQQFVQPLGRDVVAANVVARSVEAAEAIMLPATELQAQQSQEQ